MSIRISPVIDARTQPGAWTDWIKSVDVAALGDFAGPIARLDHFNVTGPALGPRLGVGLSAMTYVLRDSEVGLRSRDSLGNDILMRPGGLVWMQAGCGVVHEHRPAEIGRELRCLHLCVNHNPSTAHAGPAVSRLEPEQVPEWWGRSGDCVRIAAGSYAGHAPVEAQASPFNLLDVRLRCVVYLDIGPGHNALVYVLGGFVLGLTEGHTRRLESGQAFVVHNPRGNALLQLVGSAHLLILEGNAASSSIRKPREETAADPIRGRPTSIRSTTSLGEEAIAV